MQQQKRSVEWLYSIHGQCRYFQTFLLGHFQFSVTPLREEENPVSTSSHVQYLKQTSTCPERVYLNSSCCCWTFFKYLVFIVLYNDLSYWKQFTLTYYQWELWGSSQSGIIQGVLTAEPYFAMSEMSNFFEKPTKIEEHPRTNEAALGKTESIRLLFCYKTKISY